MIPNAFALVSARLSRAFSERAALLHSTKISLRTFKSQVSIQHSVALKKSSSDTVAYIFELVSKKNAICNASEPKTQFFLVGIKKFKTQKFNAFWERTCVQNMWKKCSRAFTKSLHNRFFNACSLSNLCSNKILYSQHVSIISSKTNLLRI
jgi:hypothetical protein